MLIAYFSLAIGVSFLCSILEAVLLSITPAYVSACKESGMKMGKLLEKQKSNIDRSLAAILSLNTIAHTVGAAGVGAQAQVVFQNIPLSIISGVLTLLILLLSEIIPKTLGASLWRVLAIPSVYLIEVLVWCMWPLVVMSQIVSKALSPQKATPTISRDEILAMANLGQREGIIDEQGARTLQSIVHFQSLRVADVHTPRSVVITLKAGDTIRDVMQRKDSLTYSRYPVIREPEQIVGFVLLNDILNAAANDEWELPIGKLVRKVIMIMEKTPIKSALRIFLQKKEHMAVVLDEFGSFAGVLSLEDVVESLIGHEIMDEADDVEDLREYARQTTQHQPGTLPPSSENHAVDRLGN